MRKRLLAAALALCLILSSCAGAKKRHLLLRIPQQRGAIHPVPTRKLLSVWAAMLLLK